MERKSLPAISHQKVVVLINGELTLKGSDELEVVIKGSSVSDMTLQQQGDELWVHCQSSCAVRVPYDADVRIERVSGNATIKSLEGNLLIQRVDGHLTLRSVGTVVLDSLSGHLAAKNISGDLKVGIIEGNASISDVQGNLVVERGVEGNLSICDLDGDGSARAEGNINLNLDPGPGNSYHFISEGNLFCRIPADASVKVNLLRASSLSIKIPDLDVSDRPRAPYSFELGDQDADLTLSAEGNLGIGILPSDWGMQDLDVEISEDLDSMADAITEQVTQQISAQMEMLEQQIEAQLANFPKMVVTTGLSKEEADRINERARQASERAAARAQEKMRRAQERLERKLESARRRAELKARSAELAARDRRRRSESYEWSPPQAEPPSQPVSDEERLMVLQMLEQQQITLEQAEQLLAALEGREA